MKEPMKIMWYILGATLCLKRESRGRGIVGYERDFLAVNNSCTSWNFEEVLFIVASKWRNTLFGVKFILLFKAYIKLSCNDLHCSFLWIDQSVYAVQAARLIYQSNLKITQIQQLRHVRLLSMFRSKRPLEIIIFTS